MDDKMKIQLLVDNERYPLVINRKDEYLWRDAAKQINNRLKEIRVKWPQKSSHEHWVMTAITLAYENISMKDRNDTAPYLEKLQELTREIEQHISNKEEE